MTILSFSDGRVQITMHRKAIKEHSLMKFTYFLLLASLTFCQHSNANNSNNTTNLHEESPEAKLGSYSVSKTLPDLLSHSEISGFKEMVEINDAIEWEVFVPNNYDKAIPAGVIVYISPQRTGKIPPEWKELFEEHNLIWVGANKSGNKISVKKRIAYAMLGKNFIEKNYTINPERVYLSGFSGGGRVASMIAPYNPDIFKGAIYNCGVNFWGTDTPTELEKVKNNRFVFVTGRNDFNLEDTKMVHRQYKKSGIENSKLLIVSRMGHRNPRAKYFEQAIEYLDKGKT